MRTTRMERYLELWHDSADYIMNELADDYEIVCAYISDTYDKLTPSITQMTVALSLLFMRHVMRGGEEFIGVALELEGTIRYHVGDGIALRIYYEMRWEMIQYFAEYFGVDSDAVGNFFEKNFARESM